MNPFYVLYIIAGYFTLLYIISRLTTKKTTNTTFFVGTRKSRWYVVAFAMIGANVSGVTFISVPGMVAAKSFSYLEMVLGFVVGNIIIAYVLIPLFYKMNLVSIYEYLKERFGIYSYKTGAWIFFVAKMIGASVRLFIMCIALQLVLFDPLGIPFFLNVVSTVAIVWLYTFKGGVKTLVWTDSMKTFFLLASVVLCVVIISTGLDMSFPKMVNSIWDHTYSQMFFFDDVNDGRFFFKQFFAGVFTAIATIGLDQDMMQKTLSCKNFRESQKNMIVSGILNFVMVLLFLMLGVLLFIYANAESIEIPKNSDELFPKIATLGYLPLTAAFIFIIGLVAAGYSAAGSALTSLTTSFTVDIFSAGKVKSDDEISRARKVIHIVMAALMGLTIIIFQLLNSTSVIDAVYILSGYTYGPILGMFAFGLFTKFAVKDKFIPLVIILAPALCFLIQQNSVTWFGGYKFSYEILILNAIFTYIGFFFLRVKKSIVLR